VEVDAVRNRLAQDGRRTTNGRRLAVAQRKCKAGVEEGAISLVLEIVIVLVLASDQIENEERER